MAFSHIPVMLSETVDALRVKEDGTYLDGTCGYAGHAYEIAKRLNGQGRYFGFDRDEEALRAASEKLSVFGDTVRLFHENHENAVRTLKREQITGVDGILLDLGVSSPQIDNAERGFSYMQDAPLDMRMDRTEGLTAADIVNGYAEEELVRIFRDYGEEKFAAQIAKRIVREREKAPVTTTFALNDIVYAAVPNKARVKGSHPSKRIFQALRIACNRELDILENAVGEMISFLNPDGRFAVITFHSLEDRIVKRAFRTAENPCTCPKSFPVCTCGKKSEGRIVFRKALTAGEEECRQNPRAKSAKLRVFEKKGN